MHAHFKMILFKNNIDKLFFSSSLLSIILPWEYDISEDTKEDLSRIFRSSLHPFPTLRVSRRFSSPERNVISVASALFLLKGIQKKKYTASKRSNKTPRCFLLQGTTQVRVSRIHRWTSREGGKKSAGWRANNNDAEIENTARRRRKRRKESGIRVAGT